MKKPASAPYWKRAYEKLCALVKDRFAVTDDELTAIHLSARGHAGGIQSPKRLADAEPVAKAMSYADRQAAVERAVTEQLGPLEPPNYCYVEDLFDDVAIIIRYPDRTLWRYPYAIGLAGVVELGDPVQVEVEYEEVDPAEYAPLFKADAERHLIYGVVAEPYAVDAHGDWLDESEIERMSHDFMLKSQVMKREHADPAPYTQVVESFIAPADMEIAGGRVRKGSWIMVTKVDVAQPEGAQLWADVKSGAVTGYSYAGAGRRTPKELTAA